MSSTTQPTADWHRGRVASWLVSVDHKRIGALYLGWAGVFFFIAGVLTILMRLQMTRPDASILGSGTYRGVLTMHGTLLVFFVFLPVVTGLATFIVPLMIGARTIAMPGSAAVALWLAMPRNPGVSSPGPARESSSRVTQLERAEAPTALPPPARGDVAVGGMSKEQPQEVRGGNERRQEPALGASTTVAETAAAKDETATARSTLNRSPELRKDSGRPGADSAQPAALPPARVAPAAEALADRSTESSRSARAMATAGVEIPSPDPAVRWRIAGSAVQHTINGGSSWEAASTGITAQFLAGSAPSTSTCWLVGRGGIVLLLTDGVRWRRLPFPEPTDLSAVHATDPLRATVTAADGRTFTTSDGGVTWVRPAPQDF